VRFPHWNQGAPVSIDVTFMGASQRTILPEQRLPAHVSDLVAADPRLWRRNAPTFSSLRVPALYDGIDVLYRLVGSGVEFDFLVSPGADPHQIQMRFSGADHVFIRKDGALSAAGPGEEVREGKPMAYQEWAGRRHLV